MLSAVVLPLFFSFHVASPIIETKPSINNSAIYIAKHSGGGNTDHGDDPHDEHHDGGLPANQHKNDHKPPSDPYAGTVPNDQSPY